MSASYELLIGIDWATQVHQVCVVARDGAVVEECGVEHTAQGIQTFVDRILNRVGGHGEHIAVAIETPRGALVETLVERGLHVYALNPMQLDRFRDRHTVAARRTTAATLTSWAMLCGLICQSSAASNLTIR